MRIFLRMDRSALMMVRWSRVSALAICTASLGLGFLFLHAQEPVPPTTQDPPDQTLSHEAIVATYLALSSPRSRSEFAYCLELDGEDAPPDVVVSLAQKDIAVYPASQCTYVGESSGSYHNQSRRPAEFIRLSDFHRDSEHYASVGYSSYHHGLWGSFGRCTLEYFYDKWHVSCASHGVS